MNVKDDNPPLIRIATRIHIHWIVGLGFKGVLQEISRHSFCATKTYSKVNVEKISLLWAILTFIMYVYNKWKLHISNNKTPYICYCVVLSSWVILCVGCIWLIHIFRRHIILWLSELHWWKPNVRKRSACIALGTRTSIFPLLSTLNSIGINSGT